MSDSLKDTPVTRENDSDNYYSIKMDAATEAIWFGFAEEVAIASRHETPIGKAPGIVTVITSDEIKNLGYRTIVEVLRIVPGLWFDLGIL